MARTQAARIMADRLMGGTLRDTIIAHRRARAPWTGIAALLNREYGVVVTGETLRTWAESLGVESAPDSDGEATG